MPRTPRVPRVIRGKRPRRGGRLLARVAGAALLSGAAIAIITVFGEFPVSDSPAPFSGASARLSSTAGEFGALEPDKPLVSPDKKRDADTSMDSAHAQRSPLPFNAPDAATYRAEVERNPHETPPSLLRFAAEVAQRQAEVQRTPHLRGTLFDDLGRCALDAQRQLPSSARSFCLLQLRQLASRHPAQFAEPLRDLLSQTPDAVALGAPLRGLQ